MKHLDDVNETYWQHFKFASRIGLILIRAGMLVIIHAIYPNVFKTSGSDTIKKLHKTLEKRNDE